MTQSSTTVYYSSYRNLAPDQQAIAPSKSGYYRVTADRFLVAPYRRFENVMSIKQHHQRDGVEFKVLRTDNASKTGPKSSGEVVTLRATVSSEMAEYVRSHPSKARLLREAIALHQEKNEES